MPPTHGVILCGGKGTRLGNIGTNIQKCMLPISGRPLLEITIRMLALAGCKNIIFVVGHKSEQVIDFVGSGEKFGIHSAYKQGSGSSTFLSVANCIDDIERDFFYIHGNILFNQNLITSISDIYNAENCDVLGIANNCRTIKHARIAIDDCRTITEVNTQDNDQYCSWPVFMGCSIYKKDTIERHIKEGGSGMTETAIQAKIANGGKALGYVYSQPWHHIETEDDYILARDMDVDSLFAEATSPWFMEK